MSRDFRNLFAAFNEEGVRYLIVGAHAVAHHHKPRFTKDMDVWVDTTSDNAERVVRALLKFGAPKSHVSHVDFADAGQFIQIGIAPVRIDILTELEPLSFGEAWRNRAKGVFMDQSVFVLGMKDLIANKKHANRPQDRLDVRALEVKLRSQAKGKPPRRRK